MTSYLDTENPYNFPEVKDDTKEDLIAIGGDLSTERLLYAYTHGFFPWYNEGDPICWWSPNPRCVILKQTFKLSRTIKRALRNNTITFSINQDFDSVITNCSMPRMVNGKVEKETWLLPEMIDAYKNLHRLGYAISAEAFEKDTLIAGLYGVKIGRIFFGESMFHKKNEASKIVLANFLEYLWSNNFILLDCQVPTEHIFHYGAVLINRMDFINFLKCEFTDFVI